MTKYRSLSFGERLCLICEDLGPVFTKLGQMLSTRYDLLSRSDCQALQKLLGDIREISWDEILPIIEGSLGKSIDKVFLEFDKKTIASASIAQVYKAKLKDGSLVAMKVRRPRIGFYIKKDILILKSLVFLVQIFSGKLRNIQINKVVDEMHRWLMEEIDFQHEANNIQLIRGYYKTAKDKAGIYSELFDKLIIPKVYIEYCSEELIVMEFVSGIPLTMYEKIKNDPRYNIEESLKTYNLMSWRHWLISDKEEFIFHADQHPANILLQPDGAVAIVDFGLVGRLNPNEADSLRKTFLSIYAHDVEGSIRRTLDMSNVPYEKYADQIRQDVHSYFRNISSMSVGFWFMGFIKIFIKHKVPLPENLILFGRTNAVLDGLIQSVLPGRTMIDLLGKELKESLIRQTIRNIASINLSSVSYVMSERIKESPEVFINYMYKFFNRNDT